MKSSNLEELIFTVVWSGVLLSCMAQCSVVWCSAVFYFTFWHDVV